jgi:enoyl-CoA hydratase/carnithine racemase
MAKDTGEASNQTGKGPILIDNADGVSLITLNRPDALNAFNQELWLATAEALSAAARDDSIRCAVVTGTGRAFSAGQDLGELNDPSAFEGTEPGYEVFIRVAEAFPKPLIAAVNGLGVGIGMTLLLHCDLVYISEEARLKVPFISLGVTTEAAASYLMPAIMGWQRASKVLYTEPWTSAQEAVELGIAIESVAPEELMERTMEMARHIGTLPLGPLLATKRLLTEARIDAVRAARARETEAFVDLVSAMTRPAADG